MKAVTPIVSSLFAAVFSVSAAYADTTITRIYTIEMGDNMSGSPIPVLDLTNITGGSLSVVESMAQPIEYIENVTLEFENAPTLTVARLSKVTDGSKQCNGYGSYGDVYNGSVKDQWLFREVELTLCPQGYGPMPFLDANYTISAKTYEAYDSETPSLPGFMLAEGTIHSIDVTPNPVTDVYTTTLNGKPLTLELLKHSGEVELESQGMRYGIILNANWMGNGERQLVIDNSPVSPFSKTIAIMVETIPGPEGDMETLRIVYADESGQRQETYPTELRMLVEQAYGPIDPMM
ncbi:hypothetical protein [Reinekea sp. G2M2-21]|uniref:hypothetical protein n=1 Tax=Reinekea sp. G2M2-21 TaxID=2788942 RepID=UPI0018AA48D8|nr:hypothetical protein [Reinekea sp. G2M2-21]